MTNTAALTARLALALDEVDRLKNDTDGSPLALAAIDAAVLSAAMIREAVRHAEERDAAKALGYIAPAATASRNLSRTLRLVDTCADKAAAALADYIFAETAEDEDEDEDDTYTPTPAPTDPTRVPAETLAPGDVVSIDGEWGTVRWRSTDASGVTLALDNDWCWTGIRPGTLLLCGRAS